jgi:hypothetical protein
MEAACVLMLSISSSLINMVRPCGFGILRVASICPPMTKISNANRIEINALTTAGIKPSAIARQLNLKYETVKKHVQRQKLIKDLPPKVVVKKGYFTGRIPGIIRRYLEEDPRARLDDIMAACELTCHKSTLAKYLNANGLERTKAKRNILLRDVNRAKRIEFCKIMLEKTDEDIKRILWTDETMVKAYPNGEAVFEFGKTSSKQFKIDTSLSLMVNATLNSIPNICKNEVLNVFIIVTHCYIRCILPLSSDEKIWHTSTDGTCNLVRFSL